VPIAGRDGQSHCAGDVDGITPQSAGETVTRQIAKEEVRKVTIPSIVHHAGKLAGVAFFLGISREMLAGRATYSFERRRGEWGTPHWGAPSTSVVSRCLALRSP
jgi:hypothetical protein